MKVNLKLAVTGIGLLISLSSFLLMNTNANYKLNRIITGTVHYQESEYPAPTPWHGELFPLSGVSVIAYENNNRLSIGTMTDDDGNYSISLPSNVTKLRYEYVGLQTVELN